MKKKGMKREGMRKKGRRVGGTEGWMEPSRTSRTPLSIKCISTDIHTHRGNLFDF